MTSETPALASRGISLPLWTIIAPVVAGLILLAAGFNLAAGGVFLTVLAVSLASSVFAAVHHAEVVAHRVGEPFGSLVLALAVTGIEAALILSMMMAGGEDMAVFPP